MTYKKTLKKTTQAISPILLHLHLVSTPVYEAAKTGNFLETLLAPILETPE